MSITEHPTTRSFLHARLDAEARRLTAWLAFWIILPNLGFATLWFIGSPPRYPDIIATGIVGLLLRRQGGLTQFAALLVMLFYSAGMFVCRMFGMGPGYLMQALAFLGELDPIAAPEYILALAAFVATLIGAAWVARQPMDFRGARSVLIATVAIATVATLDFAISFQSRGSYHHDAPTGANFQSAVTLSHFADRADGHRDLLLVTVESMGTPRDPLIARRLFASFHQPDILARYDILQGRTRYFGTTTNAEVRELCGHWGNYQPLLDRAAPECLPARLARHGYQTIAMHGFHASFFQREDWYPHVGFQRMMFDSALIRQGAGECPGVFPGACDRDIPAIIARTMKAAKTPQFIYWMTLNSHIPVPISAQLHTDRCANFDPLLAEQRPMACRMLLLWDEAFRALAQQMIQPDFPEADVLIVGDHMPPFFSRKQRIAFDKDDVPWILLRAKSKAAASDRNHSR